MRGVLALAIVLVAATTARAQDTVTFKSGSKLDCQVLEYKSGILRMKEPSGNVRTSSISEVAQITFGEQQPAIATEQQDAQLRRTTLKEVATLPPKRRQSLVHASVFGTVVVAKIEPDARTRDMFTVLVVDASGNKLPSGARAHWVKDRDTFVQVRCVLQAPERTALRLRKDDEMNVSGSIERVEVEPATKDTFEIVRLYLKDVKAN
jgi:hypothetical protein